MSDGRPSAQGWHRAVAGGSWAWMEPVHVWTSKAVACHQLWDPEGLLSHAVHLDDLDLKVTGQHSEGGLKHLEKLYLRRAHISPCLLVHRLSQEGLSLEGSAYVCTRSLPHHIPSSALDGEERNTAHTDPSLMTRHGGHKSPAVRLWVIHLHRAEVRLSIIAPHSVEAPTAGH